MYFWTDEQFAEMMDNVAKTYSIVTKNRIRSYLK